MYTLIRKGNNEDLKAKQCNHYSSVLLHSLLTQWPSTSTTDSIPQLTMYLEPSTAMLSHLHMFSSSSAPFFHPPIFTCSLHLLPSFSTLPFFFLPSLHLMVILLSLFCIFSTLLTFSIWHKDQCTYTVYHHDNTDAVLVLYVFWGLWIWGFCRSPYENENIWYRGT